MFASPAAATNSSSAERRSARAVSRTCRSAPPPASWSVSSASSPADRSRSAERRFHRLASARALSRSSVFGPAESSGAVSERRRAPVHSTNRVRTMAASAPVAIPFPSNLPHQSPRRSAKMAPFWKPTPSQKEMPTIVALRTSMPSCTTIRIPRTNSSPSTVSR